MNVFSPLEEKEDCPICFLPIPIGERRATYYSCCGKMMCNGCAFNFTKATKKETRACPFCRGCRATECSEKMEIERLQRRAERNDASTISKLVTALHGGENGTQMDPFEADLLILRAAEAGNTTSISSLGQMCFNRGNEWHHSAVQITTIAAKLRSVSAHNILGNDYLDRDCIEEGVKHFVYAVQGGHKKSLHDLKTLRKERPDFLSGEELERIEGIYAEVAKKEWSEERVEAEKYRVAHGLGK